jgi:hypothetical protein
MTPSAISAEEISSAGPDLPIASATVFFVFFIFLLAQCGEFLLSQECNTSGAIMQ